jgi:NADH-quinone oxidoreductase subunit C/D
MAEAQAVAPETQNNANQSAPFIDPRPAFAVVEELRAKFGDSLLLQATRDDMPTIWVERSQLLEVLMFLRTLPKPYVMLYDLSAIDERLRVHREGQPASDFTVFYHLLSLERNTDIRIKVALKDGDANLIRIV